LDENNRIIDMKPELSDFRTEVINGLLSTPKKISSKFFYDKEGSEIFDEITKLPEYYLTRSEMEILEKRGMDIGRVIGENATVIELGSGSGKKALLLLRALKKTRELVFVDISVEALKGAMILIRHEYPQMPVMSICADYTKTDIMEKIDISGRKAIVFLGSTIGNMEPGDARTFISGCMRLLSSGETLTIGVDLKKNKSELEKAYNDNKGVTARFNLNLISRINRELGTDIPNGAFIHKAIYNDDLGRIEMHLESTRRQSFDIAGHEVIFEKGETIHTENSYKFSIEEFTSMLKTAGFREIKILQDEEQKYGLFTATA
jgi:dimethylhistidine N-methyltransferase